MVKYENREWWVDYAKTIGIFLVVFIHTIQINFNNVAFSVDKSILLFGGVFHMPLFFFISGYLYKNIKPKIAIKKYFKRLIIPYIFFYFIGMVIFIQFKGLYTNSDVLFSTIGSLLIGMILSDETITAANGPIWFLLALFIVIILFSLFQKYLKDDKHILIVILAINVLLYILHILKINLYFSFDSALLGIMFFYVGYISKKYNLMSYFKNNYINITLVIMFLAMAYLEFIYNGSLGLRSASWDGSFIIGYIGAFAGIIMIIALSSILSQFKSKIIFLISINTLTIMGLDQILRHFIALISKKIKIITIYPLSSAFITALAVIFIAVIIAMFLNKYAPVFIGNNDNFNYGKYLNTLRNYRTRKRPDN